MIGRALGIAIVCLMAMQPWEGAQAFTVGPAEIEVEPYAKAGTIAWDELQGVGGHKSLVALGINALARFDRLAVGFNFENWWLGEKLDDDAGIIPNEGRRFYTDLRYGFRPTESLELYPFAGLGYEHWSRDDAVNSWTSINFPYAAVGGGAEYEHCYGKIGLLMPFAATADVGPNPTSRIGVTADAGLRLFDFTVGVFFRSIGFEDPDAKMVQAGVMLGYRFR